MAQTYTEARYGLLSERVSGAVSNPTDDYIEGLCNYLADSYDLVIELLGPNEQRTPVSGGVENV